MFATGPDLLPSSDGDFMMSGDSKFDGDRASDKIKLSQQSKEKPYGRSAFDTESEGSRVRP